MVTTLSSRKHIKYLSHVMFFLKVTIKRGLIHNAQSPQVTVAEEVAELCRNEAETQSKHCRFAYGIRAAL